MSTTPIKSTKIFFLFFVFEFGVFLILFFFFRAQNNSNALTAGRDVNAMTDVEKEQAIAEALVNAPPAEMTTEEKIGEASAVSSMLMEDAAETQLVGSFEGRAHPGSGTVRIVNENGKRVLVFQDDFRTDPGPQLHVFLSGTKDPKNSADLHAVGDVDLGRLKSTSGAQMYTLPQEINFEINSVVVYCVPFKVIFGVANF